MSFVQPRTWGYSVPAALLLMAPFDILASLAMDIYLPVVPAMPGILRTTPAVVQLTLALYMVTLGLGQILFGPLSDRFGRRPVLIGGALLFATASLLLAMTTSAPIFVGLRFLQGMGASAALVATFATVRDIYAEKPEGTVIYGMFSSILAFVPALGPITGAILANSYGWRAIFVTLAVLAAAALAHAWLRWPETRTVNGPAQQAAFRRILGSFTFWTYTLGFSTAMGAFFVFFSTAPRVLIGQAGFSEMAFSVAFATVALLMVLTTRLARAPIARWGIPGSLARGMGTIIFGAVLLMAGQLLWTASFWTFVLPMWIIAIGMIFTVSVTANGALQEFGAMAGTAVALHFCVQSVIVAGAGTVLVVLLDGDTAWPLIAYCSIMASVTLTALARLHWAKILLGRCNHLHLHRDIE